MKLTTTLTAIAATLALALLPAVALAGGSPTHSEAQKQCRQERTSMGSQAFKALYGTNKNGANAFGKCVSHRQRQDTTDESNAKSNAAQQCKAEQAQDPTAFQQKYGTGKHGHNAFGKCVSQKAKAQSDRDESTQVKAEDNAAKACKAEQAQDPTAFQKKYGTNHNGHNAFGKCVSQRAKAQEQQQSGSSSGGPGSGSGGY